jgi:hypothetical protein
MNSNKIMLGGGQGMEGRGYCFWYIFLGWNVYDLP